MKVLVLGGAGYIGELIVDQLATRGHKPVVVDQLLYTTYYRRPNIPFLRMDITSDEFMAWLRVNQFDAIINAAAIVGDPACRVNEKLTWTVNAGAVERIVEVVKDTQTHFIQLSTCSVYGDLEGPLDEQSPTKPLSAYASSKLLAESYVSTLKRHTILRLGTVYGLSTSYGRIRSDLVVNLMSFKAALNAPIDVMGAEQWRPLIAAGDVAMCAVDAIEARIYGLYVLSHMNLQIGDIAKTICRVTGTKSKVEEKALNPNDMRNYHVSNKLARRVGLHPFITVQDSIAAMYALVKSGRLVNPWDPIHNNGVWIGEKYRGLN